MTRSFYTDWIGEIIDLGKLSKSIPLPQFFLDHPEARFITHSKRIPEPPELEIFIRKAEEILNSVKKLIADFKLSDFNAQDVAKNILKGSESGLREYDGVVRKLIEA
jgi:hypothetical protein